MNADMNADLPANLLLDLLELRRARRFIGRRVSADIGGVDSTDGNFVPPCAAQNALERLIHLEGQEVGPHLLALVGSLGCTAAGQALAIIGLLDEAMPEVVPALHRVAGTDGKQAT